MAEDESDQEAERLSEELEALAPPGPPPPLGSQAYCRRFCQVRGSARLGGSRGRGGARTARPRGVCVWGVLGPGVRGGA